jgi:hypothetical protein
MWFWYELYNIRVGSALGYKLSFLEKFLMGFHSVPLIALFNFSVCACVHMGKYLCVYKCMCLYYVSKK